MRTMPRFLELLPVRVVSLLAIVAVLLWAASVLAPVSAQSAATVRVSSLEETAYGDVALGGGQQYAGSFCTGSYPVTLEKVRLYVSNGGHSNSVPVLTIHSDSSGSPGPTVHTLSSPTIDSDLNTTDDFTSSGYVLASNSVYWLGIHRPFNSGAVVFTVTDTGNQTAEPGWSIVKGLQVNIGGWSPLSSYNPATARARIQMAVYASGDAPSTTQPVFPCTNSTAALTMEVNENSAAGTVVGQAVAADADGDTVTHTISGMDATAFNEVFSLNASTGEITVKSDASPNYEEKRSYSITVNATDGEDASGNLESPATTDDSVSVNINVNNVDETGSVGLDTETPTAGSELEASISDPDGRVLIVSAEWFIADAADGPFSSISRNFANCSSRSLTSTCYTPAVEDVGKFLKVVMVYYDGASGPRSARGNLIISSSDPTRDRRTVETISTNAVAMGGL